MKFLWILFLFIGCNSPTKDSDRILKISFPKDPSCLDPRKSADFVSSSLICLLFEGLTRCKSGAEIEPGIAESIEISKDGKIYFFHLRDSFWSNGFKVTAKDFENSWKEILSPGFPAPCSYLLYPIKNGEKYSKGQVMREDVGIFAVDEKTLKVELETPSAHFLSLTAFPLLMPAPPSPGISNGPFTLEKMKIGSEILLKKNEMFWNHEAVHLSQIDISILPDETTALNLFEKGELDLLGGPLTPIPFEAFKSGGKIFQVPMEASTFCVMNSRTLPFSNPFIRKAFKQAVQNNEILFKEIQEMGQTPSNSLFPPTLTLINNSPEKHNPRNFLSLGLKELKKETLGPLTLSYKGSPIDKRIAQTLQKIWEEELGIKVQLEQFDPTSLTQKLYAKNFTLAITAWIAQVHDPINFLERFKEEDAPKNYSGWGNENYKSLLEKALVSMDQREEFLRDAQLLIEENALLIPLYHWKFPVLANSTIEELPTNISGGILFEKVVKKPTQLSSSHH